jgi:transcriptional regulator with XRE-family HTH domain
MAHRVDVHVGARIRQRRFLLGMTQQSLAANIGVTFQQLQKYEMGANRVSASRLWDIARLLEVPVSFFFEGLGRQGDGVIDASSGPRGAGQAGKPGGAGGRSAAVLAAALPAVEDAAADRDAATLLRAFCAIPPTQRRKLLDLARSLSDSSG